MDIILVVLVSLCVIVFVLLIGLYHVYSRGVNMNEDIAEMNNKLDNIVKDAEESNETMNTMNDKIDDDTIQQNVSDLKADLDAYETRMNSNNNAHLSNINESHSNMHTNIDNITIDLNTVQSNILEFKNGYTESLAEIEHAFVNIRSDMNKGLTYQESRDADLERRLVEYKVSNDEAIDRLEQKYTELAEEMEPQYDLQKSNAERIETVENEITPRTYALDYDFKKYSLINHYESKYIRFSSMYVFNVDRFRCTPIHYLVDIHGVPNMLVHLFEARDGNTYERTYIVLNINQIVTKIGNKMLHTQSNNEPVEIPSDKKINHLGSLYVPPIMDVILTDNNTKETVSFRHHYPTQLFVSSNGDEFFKFYNNRNNVSVHHEQIRHRKAIDSVVSSVFLRYKFSPFSVFEFQQNEVVYWHDLVKYPGNNKFVTDNGVAYNGNETPIIYIPIGAGIKILAVHDVKVFEITHSVKTRDQREYDREIPLIHCFSKDKYKDERCFFVGGNPIVATAFNMTIKLQLNKNAGLYSKHFSQPIFKVI